MVHGGMELVYRRPSNEIKDAVDEGHAQQMIHRVPDRAQRQIPDERSGTWGGTKSGFVALEGMGLRPAPGDQLVKSDAFEVRPAQRTSTKRQAKSKQAKGRRQRLESE
jgi:hypothetical protein